MTDKTDKTLSAAAQAISADLQLSATEYDETHNATTADDIFEKHLPEGLTVKLAEQSKHYDRTFGAAMIDANSHLMHKALKANPDADKSVDYKLTAKGLAGEKFTATITPIKTGVMGGRDGQPEKAWTSHGLSRISHTSTVHGRRSDLGIAIDNAKTMAEEILKAK